MSWRQVETDERGWERGVRVVHKYTRDLRCRTSALALDGGVVGGGDFARYAGAWVSRGCAEKKYIAREWEESGEESDDNDDEER